MLDIPPNIESQRENLVNRHNFGTNQPFSNVATITDPILFTKFVYVVWNGRHSIEIRSQTVGKLVLYGRHSIV